jgi:hypothetical protein
MVRRPDIRGGSKVGVKCSSRGCLLAPFLLIAVLLVSCGSDSRRASEEPNEPRQDLVANNARLSFLRDCPMALRPGRQAQRGVVAAIGPEVQRVFSETDIKGFTVSALAALDRSSYVPRFASDHYRRRVKEECGENTALRSWVVFINFPAAPDASFVPAVAYFARTSGGWCLWFRYYPNKPGSSLLSGC